MGTVDKSLKVGFGCLLFQLIQKVLQNWGLTPVPESLEGALLDRSQTSPLVPSHRSYLPISLLPWPGGKSPRYPGLEENLPATLAGRKISLLPWPGGKSPCYPGREEGCLTWPHSPPSQLLSWRRFLPFNSLLAIILNPVFFRIPVSVATCMNNSLLLQLYLVSLSARVIMQKKKYYPRHSPCTQRSNNSDGEIDTMKVTLGYPWRFSGWESLLPLQGTWVESPSLGTRIPYAV